jgi:hypothetical protein
MCCLVTGEGGLWAGVGGEVVVVTEDGRVLHWHACPSNQSIRPNSKIPIFGPTKSINRHNKNLWERPRNTTIALDMLCIARLPQRCMR